MQKNRPTWIASLAKVFVLREAWILQKCSHWAHGSLILRRASKAISGEEYTQLASLFVHFLRCKNSCIARYAPIFTP